MKLDIHNNIKAVHALSPQAAGTTGTGLSSDIVDRKGYEGVEIIVHHGTSVATDYANTLVVLEGDTTGAMTSVADADLIGTEAGASLPVQATARTSGAGLNVAKRIGYKGRKRYVQFKQVNVGAATGIVGGVVLLHTPDSGPVSGQ